MFTAIELVTFYQMILTTFVEYDVSAMTCGFGLQENGKVEIEMPLEILRYDNYDICVAEQNYILALAFTFGLAIIVLKFWLCFVLFYYQKQLKKEAAAKTNPDGNDASDNLKDSEKELEPIEKTSPKKIDTSDKLKDSDEELERVEKTSNKRVDISDHLKDSSKELSRVEKASHKRSNTSSNLKDSFKELDLSENAKKGPTQFD